MIATSAAALEEAAARVVSFGGASAWCATAPTRPT
jgi:hypothetical protein